MVTFYTPLLPLRISGSCRILPQLRLRFRTRSLTWNRACCGSCVDLRGVDVLCRPRRGFNKEQKMQGRSIAPIGVRVPDQAANLDGQCTHLETKDSKVGKSRA